MIKLLRTGRKVGRTIYEGDVLIGVMDTSELAAEVVAAVNYCRTHWRRGGEGGEGS